MFFKTVLFIFAIVGFSNGLKCFTCEFFEDEFGNIDPPEEEAILCHQKHGSLIRDTGSTDFVYYEFTALVDGKWKFTERAFERDIDNSLIGMCVNLPDEDNYTNQKWCYCNKDTCNVDLKGE